MRVVIDCTRHVARASESDRSLFGRWRHDGDEVARNELVTRHLPLARNLARRYVRTGEPIEDLYQVASLGLVKAINRYDPEQEAAFSSFAVPTILGDLRRHFRDRGCGLHLPRSLQEFVHKVEKTAGQMTRRTGYSPSPADIAKHLAVDLEDVLDALEAITKRRATSLDDPISIEPGEEAGTQHDIIGADEQGYGLVELSMSLGVAVTGLPDLDRRVFRLRFRDGLKQVEIAEQIGVSQMQVSRILRRTTDRLRDNVELV